MGSQMKGKVILPALLLFIMISAAYSQQISHQVILPGAGVVLQGGISYSQTVGETAVEIIGGFDYVLTQGFQQPRLKITLGEQPQGSGVKVYPNPVIDFLSLELYGESSRSYNISVININGQKVYTEELIFSENHWYIREVNMRNMAKGFYFIRVISKDGMINRSFKIEKM